MFDAIKRLFSRHDNNTPQESTDATDTEGFTAVPNGNASSQPEVNKNGNAVVTATDPSEITQNGNHNHIAAENGSDLPSSDGYVSVISERPKNEDSINVAMSVDNDIMPGSGMQKITNVSVNTDKDTMTKFMEENPDPRASGKGPLKPLAEQPIAPPVQAVYSTQLQRTPMETDDTLIGDIGITSVASTNPVKTIPEPQIILEVKEEKPIVVPPKKMDIEVSAPSTHVKPQLNEPPPPTTQVQRPPTQRAPLNKRMVQNRADGYSFKVCDMNRLRRYIVLGSEHNTYYSTPGQLPQLGKSLQNTLDNIKCLKNLLNQGRHEEVLETITEYSLAGRVAKEEPILTILSVCANHTNLEIRKAAYNRVVKICNIPTKLFRFLDLTQDDIDFKREQNPPQPQKFRNERKRKKNLEKDLEQLKIEEGKPKEPSENISEPTKKKVKKNEPEFKKVNVQPKKSSGWGRMRRKCVSKFYEDEKKNSARLLYLMTKYKKRNNWSHQEVVTYAHPTMSGDYKSSKDLVMKYCTSGYDKIKDKCVVRAGMSEDMSEVIDYIDVLEKVSKLSPTTEGDEDKLLEILQTHGERDNRKGNAEVFACQSINEMPDNPEGKRSPIQVVREHIPTGFLNSKRVWEALLKDMPMTALIRNLGKMSKMGLFGPGNQENVDTAVNSLTNPLKLKRGRVHPMKILIAMKIYEQGKGDKGDLEWNVNRDIVKALDKAFYLSFQNPEAKEVHKTGKKFMLCLDVSGSMTFHGCKGCELITPAIASVAMAWVTWNIEDNVELVAFGGHLVNMKELKDRQGNLRFRKDMIIPDILKETRRINFGSTDCSLPMLHALEKKLEVDVFIVYTDSDTWAGRVHPVAALKEYNKQMNRVAKLIVLGMESNGFTIADPQDPNMMDIVGFDTNVPELVSEFAKGNLSGACGDNCEDCRIKEEAFNNLE